MLSGTGTQTGEDVNDDWQNMIFELLERSSNEIAGERFKVNRCKQLLAQRVDCVLSKMNCVDEIRWSIELDYDYSLLLWQSV